MYLYDIFIVLRPVFRAMPSIRYYISIAIICSVVQLYNSSETFAAHARTHAHTHVNTQTVEKNAVKLSTVFRVHAAVSPSSLSSSSFHLRKVVYGDTSVRAVYCRPQNLWPLIRISCARGFAIIYR